MSFRLTKANEDGNPMDERDPHGDRIDAALRTPPSENSPEFKRAMKAQSWWQTMAGTETDKHLNAWAAVVKVRLVTGDPSALPDLSDFSQGNAGKRRGSPSDMPDVLLWYSSIDKFMNEGLTESQRRLVRHIHGHGFEYREAEVCYLLEPGSGRDEFGHFEDEKWTAWMPVTVRPPAKFYARRIERKRIYQAARLLAFDAPEIDALAANWRMSKADILVTQHLRIGQEVALELGL